MILKLTSICSFVSMVYTAKFEPLPNTLLASTCSDDSEALRKSPALQTLFTELDVVENLAGDRGQQVGRGERPYTSLKICFDMLRARRMSAPQLRSHGGTNNTKKDLYQCLFGRQQRAQNDK
jgi:hypothetical protein